LPLAANLQITNLTNRDELFDEHFGGLFGEIRWQAVAVHDLAGYIEVLTAQNKWNYGEAVGFLNFNALSAREGDGSKHEWNSTGTRSGHLPQLAGRDRHPCTGKDVRQESFQCAARLRQPEN
jgi:hypothetical protein